MEENAAAPKAKLKRSFTEDVPETFIRYTDTLLGMGDEEMAIVRQKVATIKKKVLFVKRARTWSNGITPKNGIIVVIRIVVIAIGRALLTQRIIAANNSKIALSPGRLNPAGSGNSKLLAIRTTATIK